MSTESEMVKQEIIGKIKELDSTSEKVKAVALHHYLEKKKDLDVELEKEIKALTLKYDKLSEPIYSAASEIITGKRAVKEEEISELDQYIKEDEKEKLEESKGNTELIKGYWLKAFKNCDMIVPEIKEKDEPILEHVTNVEYICDENKPLEFQIVFTFSENEFFENTTLKKSFELKDDDEPIKGEGTEINWKEGKDTTVKVVKKTQKNKKSGAKRVVTKEVADESFFNFFKDHAATEGAEEKDLDEEELEEDELLAIDFDIARALVDELIPYSLEYYLGVKTPEDGEYDDYPGIDEEDDEDDDEDGAPKPKSKKKAHKKSGDSTKSGEGENKEKPECKQQ